MTKDAIEIIRADVVEKDWGWLALYCAGSVAVLIVTSLYVSGWLALLLGLLALVPLTFISVRAVTRVRRVEIHR